MAVLAGRDGLLVSSPAHLKRLPEYPVGRGSRTDCEGCFPPADLYRSTLPVTLNDCWVLSRLKSMEAPRPVELPGVSSIPEWMKHGPPCRVLLVVSILKKAYWKSDRPICRTITGFARQIVPYPWETNRFLIKGRVDRIVKIEEKRISLAAIERQLTASFMVADARVIVIEGRRPRIAAFIVPSVIGRWKLADFGKLVFNRTLRATLSQSIEPVGIPRIWRHLDALPTNTQGKTTYADLIALLDGEISRPRFPFERLVEKTFSVPCLS